MRRFLVAFGVILATGLVVQPAGAAVFSDNFDDCTTSRAFWSPFAFGHGPRYAEINNRLEITLPAASTVAAAPDSFSAGYRFNRMLRGDFDFQVDYILLDWPSGSAVRVGLNCGGANVQRSSYGWNEIPGRPRDWYSYDFGGGTPTLTSSDMTGTLRWTRTSGIWTAYYKCGNNWVVLGSRAHGNADVPLWLAAWSHDCVFSHQQVKIAFDNFTINSGTLVCPRRS